MYSAKDTRRAPVSIRKFWAIERFASGYDARCGKNPLCDHSLNVQPNER